MRTGWGCVGLYPVVCFNQHHDLSHEESVSTVSIDTVFFVGLRRAKQADVENLFSPLCIVQSLFNTHD